MKIAVRCVALAALAIGFAGRAEAGLLSSCTLTLSASGKLTMSGNATTLGTQNSGGSAAFMAVVGVNLTPRLTFSSLTVVGPPGWTSSPISELSMDSLSGMRVAYTTSGFTVTPGILLDTLTVNARITSTTGFKAGTYTANSTVTCDAG